jgi:arsenate reductase (thioredoxin)
MRNGVQAGRSSCQSAQQNPESRMKSLRIQVYNVLFLCTGNSARSILAESILNKLGNGQFRGFSAGSHPNGRVNPLVFDLLKQQDFPTEDLRSKSWDEFAGSTGVHFDFVITVCDNAAGEACPVWPGMPVTAHWGIPDPAAIEGSEMEKKAAFAQAFKAMDRRIKLFLSLPIASIDQLRIKERMQQIGKTDDAL